MSTATTHAEEVHAHAHDHEHEHHEPNFIQKYIFSEDHKTIAKQYLIMGILWAFVGGSLSILFRLQLGFPEMQLEWLRPLLGEWIDESGKLDKEFYLALVTMHGTIMPVIWPQDSLTCYPFGSSSCHQQLCSHHYSLKQDLLQVVG